MDVLEAKIKALRDFDDNLNAIVLDKVREIEPEILDMNTAQLFQGIDSRGNEITPEYAPFTVQIKRSSGQPTNRVTLKDTGDFYNSLFIEYGSDQFEIAASDEKTDKLGKKYGFQVLGLTDANLQELREMLTPELQDELKKRLDI